MRIALSFPGCHRRGGVERVVLETANHLVGVGHEVHLFCHDWDPEALDSRIHPHRVDYPRRLPLARLIRFPRRCADVMRQTGLSFDAHGGFGVLSPPGSTPGPRSGPGPVPAATIWVQSVHAAWIAISRAQRSWGERLRQRLNPVHPTVLAMEGRVFGRRRYRRLIALTPQVKRDLIDHYHMPDADVAVLPNGFSPTEFNPARRQRERDAVRAELGIAGDRKVVVFVANESERKGLSPLLRAIARLEDPTIELLAVGRLDASAHRATIARLGLTGRVHFTGPSPDVGRYYAASDVFALPTQYEAWGLVIIEAMACGLPVLTSALAGAAVAVEPGETGELLDDPRDVEEITVKLGRLLAGMGGGGDYADAEAISRSVQGYCWSSVLARYEGLLGVGEGAIANGNAGPGMAKPVEEGIL